VSRRGKRARWVDAIYEFLEKQPDGAAPLRVVAEHAMRFVPPGPAWREGEAKRQTDARYRGQDQALPDPDKLRVVRTGQKRIILKQIYAERKAGRLEKFVQSGRDWLRVVL
jgi:hypothetical protein